MPDRIFSPQPNQSEGPLSKQAELNKINAEIAAHQLGLQRRGNDPRTRNRIEGAIRNLEAKRDKFLYSK